MAERIKAAIKSPEILELVNICVINALGYKSKISSKTVDNAIDSIVSFVHSEIDLPYSVFTNSESFIL